MSEKINCGNCGMLLYYGEEIKPPALHARHPR